MRIFVIYQAEVNILTVVIHKAWGIQNPFSTSGDGVRWLLLRTPH